MEIEEIKELYVKFDNLYQENKGKCDSYLSATIARFLKEYQDHIKWHEERLKEAR